MPPYCGPSTNVAIRYGSYTGSRKSKKPHPPPRWKKNPSRKPPAGSGGSTGSPRSKHRTLKSPPPARSPAKTPCGDGKKIDRLPPGEDRGERIEKGFSYLPNRAAGCAGLSRPTVLPAWSVRSHRVRAREAGGINCSSRPDRSRSLSSRSRLGWVFYCRHGASSARDRPVPPPALPGRW